MIKHPVNKCVTWRKVKPEAIAVNAKMHPGALDWKIDDDE